MGPDISDKEKEGVVQLGKMLAGGEDQSGHLDDFDREVQHHLEKHPKYEAEHRKMHAAATGGGSEMGPSDFEEQQAKQTQALTEQSALQGAQQAQQAQGAQMPIAPSTEAPGPAGESAPYSAQKRQPPPSGPSQGPPGPGEEVA